MFLLNEKVLLIEKRSKVFLNSDKNFFSRIIFIYYLNFFGIVYWMFSGGNFLPSYCFFLFLLRPKSGVIHSYEDNINTIFGVL